MPDDYYWSGGRRVPLVRREDLIAVRPRAPEAILRGAVPDGLARKLRSYPIAETRADASLLVLRVDRRRGAVPAARELALDPDVAWTAPVYSLAGSDEPLYVTDEIVCSFRPGVSRAEQEELHRRLGTRVAAPLEVGGDAFVLRVDLAGGANPVEVANRYVDSGLVEFAHPDFVKRRAPKAVRRPPSRLDREWHLDNRGQSGGTPGADSRVRAAWRLGRGRAEVAIAVIDDGFDLGHGDFAAGRRVRATLDARSGSADASPRLEGDNHGTCVLGVAASSGGGSGVLGVAPRASIIAIRLDGSERHEAVALAAAARLGAWVVNCSWGPPDGAWWDPDDPLHRREVPLPDVVRAAMRLVTERGREGRGALLVWAAGNGNESVATDGYASSPHVLCVAASNHFDRRAIYSDHGPAVALCAPSSDINPGWGTVGGIWATDRRGSAGYNPLADHTEAFGGTSAAAPMVAGVAALCLSANPELTAAELAAILRATAAPVDPASPSWRGTGDARRSDHYGAGRVDAARAVAEARARASAPSGLRKRVGSRVLLAPRSGRS